MANTVELPVRRPSRPAESATVNKPNENRVAYLFLAPWFVGLFLLTAGPILASLYLSFTDFDLLTAPRWTGLSNYRRFAADPHFHNAVRVTFVYVVVSVPLVIAFALAVAALLSGGRRGMGAYRSAFYLPSLLGGSVAVSIMWRQIFGDDGLVNRVLRLAGIVGPSWISTPEYAIYTLVLLHVWQFGSPMLIFLAGLKQIPRELHEAAAVDGAGPLRRFFTVTLPLLTPLIFFNLVLQTINSFKAFTPAFVISGGSGGPVDATLFYTLYLYQEGFANFRMGYASAMAWALLAVIALATAGMFATARYWVYYADRDGSP
jgi:pectin-derived oligosaccharide transport system permease protein